MPADPSEHPCSPIERPQHAVLRARAPYIISKPACTAYLLSCPCRLRLCEHARARTTAAARLAAFHKTPGMSDQCPKLKKFSWKTERRGAPHLHACQPGNLHSSVGSS